MSWFNFGSTKLITTTFFNTEETKKSDKHQLIKAINRLWPRQLGLKPRSRKPFLLVAPKHFLVLLQFQFVHPSVTQTSISINHIGGNLFQILSSAISIYSAVFKSCDSETGRSFSICLAFSIKKKGVKV